MPSDIKGQISTMQKLQLLLHQPNNCLSHLIPVSATVSCSKTDFSKSRQSPQIFHISLKVHSEIFLFKIPVLLLVLFVTKQNKTKQKPLYFQEDWNNQTLLPCPCLFCNYHILLLYSDPSTLRFILWFYNLGNYEICSRQQFWSSSEVLVNIALLEFKSVSIFYVCHIFVYSALDLYLLFPPHSSDSYKLFPSVTASCPISSLV